MQQASHLLSPALRADIYCPLCSPASSALLDGGQLERQGVLSFVQLHPCGHTYCTRCFELFLLASAHVRTRSPLHLQSHFTVYCTVYTVQYCSVLFYVFYCAQFTFDPILSSFRTLYPLARMFYLLQFI